MSNASAVFCALYRWRLYPGAEQAFIEAWSRVTPLLVSERGSLGSRLHRGPDDIWYSYTQWPSAEAKAEGLARPSLVADFLVPLPPDGARPSGLPQQRLRSRPSPE